jgi:hypothetical protein
LEEKMPFLIIDIFMFIHKNINMRTTLDLPDDLATEIKILAAQERTTLKELIGELLRGGLRSRQAVPRVTTLPPVHSSAMRLNSSLISKIRKEGVR